MTKENAIKAKTLVSDIPGIENQKEPKPLKIKSPK